MGQIIVKEGLSAISEEFGRLYGPGTFVMGSLSNLRVGRISSSQIGRVAYRFMNTHGGTPATVHLYVKTGSSGYSGGQGGVLVGTICLCNNDGTPNTTATFGTIRYDVRPDYSKQEIYKACTVQNPKRMTPGTRYCLLLENESTINGEFFSVNTACVTSPAGLPTRWLSHMDWGVSYSLNNGASWTNGSITVGNDNKWRAPVLGIDFSDGVSTGRTVVESGSTSTRSIRLKQGTSYVAAREIFDAADKGRRVCGLSVNMACVSPGAVRVALTVNNSEVASATITESSANYRYETLGSNQIVQPYWYDIQFTRDVYIPKGAVAAIVIEPQGSSEWTVPSRKNGTNMGFRSPHAWVYSEAQIRGANTNGWRTYNHNNHGGSGPGNLTSFGVVMHVTKKAGANSGNSSGVSQQGSFQEFRGRRVNFVWIKSLPQGTSGDNARWLIQFKSLDSSGNVINDVAVENDTQLMADREWTGSKTWPAIVWTSGDLPANLSNYTYTNITVNRTNVMHIRPWYESGIWHENAVVADRSESKQV